LTGSFDGRFGSSVAFDGTTAFAGADGRDIAGRMNQGAAYVFLPDWIAPAAPTLSGTSPASPANANAVSVRGSAEAGSTVRLYVGQTCTGNPVAQGTAAAFASPGLSATVADNTTTTFRATAADAAGNVSSCSSSTVTYVEDSAPPVAPAIADTEPHSPSFSNIVAVKGTAEAGSTVRLYVGETCTGNPVAQGLASTFAVPGFTVSAVPSDAKTTFRATATDVAGNASACSAGYDYVEDSTAPAPPSLSGTVPSSPSNQANVAVKGSAEPGSTVRLYTSALCADQPVATGTASAFAGSGISATVPPNATTSFHATSTDAAGNTSLCSPGSIGYEQDAIAPPAPTLDGPGQVTQGSVARFTAAVSDPGLEPGGIEWTATGGLPTQRGASVTYTFATAGLYTLHVTATDRAGNTSVATSLDVVVAPLVVAPPVQQQLTRIDIAIYFTYAWSTRSATKFKRLTVQKVPAGSTVTVTCLSRRCPAALKRPLVLRNRSGTVSLKRLIAKPLRAGTILRVAVTKPGAIGMSKTLTVRKRKAPSIATGCLLPGQSKPSRC
jgi:hypothetical protein